MYLLNSRTLLYRYSKTLICSASLSSATQKETNTQMRVFDRQTKLLQRERAAHLPDHHVFDYLKEEVGYRLGDRILDIKKEMKDGLDLGCGKGFVSKNIMDVSKKKYNKT
ncbi:UNVERIFIED_CONTAM: hypothetical protein GTU68_038838 [Idotea baltica]|nr:hypothetical protein [Idotea baltica]